MRRSFHLHTRCTFRQSLQRSSPWVPGSPPTKRATLPTRVPQAHRAQACVPAYATSQFPLPAHTRTFILAILRTVRVVVDKLNLGPAGGCSPRAGQPSDRPADLDTASDAPQPDQPKHWRADEHVQHLEQVRIACGGCNDNLEQMQQCHRGVDDLEIGERQTDVSLTSNIRQRHVGWKAKRQSRTAEKECTKESNRMREGLCPMSLHQSKSIATYCTPRPSLLSNGHML